jgi:hypothetical protein
MVSAEQQKFLGLNAKESRLLRVLNKGPLNTSNVAKKASLPRVTALRLLAGLHVRGFVARHKAHTEVRWSLVASKLIRKRLELSLEEREKTAFGKLITLSDIASVSIYKGAHEMLLSNQKFLTAHPGERLYCIEPNAIWRHVAKVPQADWVHLNKSLKARHIIGEFVLEDGFAHAMGGTVEDMLGETFFAIAKDTRVMPKGTISSPVEVMIFRDRALLADWEQLVAVEVTSASIVKALKGLFVTLQNVSKPVRV